MLPLLTGNLRTNRGTWAVPHACYPALGSVLHDLAPNEPYDPRFLGQCLETTYFDTPGGDLLAARRAKRRYLTLRVRRYGPPYRPGHPAPADAPVYAVSAKTESDKWRLEIDPAAAGELLEGGPGWPALLPPDLRSRLREIAGGDELLPTVTASCRRYAVENEQDRYTLDVGLRTDRGKRLPCGVLEFKSPDPDAVVPAMLARLALRPVRLSKFQWACSW